jgi:carboxymethylenebutenolidase
MGEKVTFPSNGSTAHGYLAVPESAGGPGLIVIQEWWGLVDHIIDLTDRFAAAGFVALAPDLYGGKTTHDAETANKYLQELPVDRAARDLSGAVDYLLGREEVTSSTLGAVGFCMGGAFVLLLAKNERDKISAAVAAYPVAAVDLGELSDVSAKVSLHVGSKDDFVSTESVEELASKLRTESGTEVEVHIYPERGHAFLNDENLLGTYDKEAADLLWQRTIEFLTSNVA